MEQLYHYLWKYLLFGRRLTLDDGCSLTIINPGRHNTNSGPDFTDAKIEINNQKWVGNIEMHIKASDWFRHGHDTDPAYQTIILHVVSESDKKIFRPDGSIIPQLTVGFPRSFLNLYCNLSEKISDVRCLSRLQEVDSLTLECWLESLSIERLQMKAERILNEVNFLGGDWQRACFVTLARGLGFGLNGEPFEILARSLPLNYLHRHSDNLFQIEALLFGQAGFLNSQLHQFDEYYQALCREYLFLARKYNLRPINSSLWKYSRTRPQNFPHRRIALLAQAVKGGFSLLSNICNLSKTPEEIRELFNFKHDGYWLSHFGFNSDQSGMPPYMNINSLNLLVLNVAAPILYAYAQSKGNPDLIERAIDLQRILPAEKNSIINRWASANIKADNAFRSQALIHLRKEYCDRNRCLDCRIACNLFKKQIFL